MLVLSCLYYYQRHHYVMFYLGLFPVSGCRLNCYENCFISRIIYSWYSSQIIFNDEINITRLNCSFNYAAQQEKCSCAPSCALFDQLVPEVNFDMRDPGLKEIQEVVRASIASSERTPALKPQFRWTGTSPQKDQGPHSGLQHLQIDSHFWASNIKLASTRKRYYHQVYNIGHTLHYCD